MAAPQHIAAPHLDTSNRQTSSTWRVTRGGRKLWYRLVVLQEPERARACGSGPKSTTDRRPVDPPPVIELRIFEGDSMESGKDITFTYNANFFLFTTLEHARPVANGRVNTPAATTPPVLTGMFVSGMAYLDRPAEAGYFLFPDLSVRHEGRYKLIFNLYEQTKEDKDKDPETTRAPPRTTVQSPADFSDIDESFDHRLKVESRPFSVFSAKKFPGLSESTVLSRTISEQGCRVRIRRDVRMRRRENKPSSGNDYEAKKEEYERRQRTQTPEIKPDPYRPRSLSNSSMDRSPYGDPYSRRPSVPDYHQAPPPPPPPPSYGSTPHTPTSSGGHLHFGQSTSTTYPPPPQQYAPPPSSQQAQASPLTTKQPPYHPSSSQRGYSGPQYNPTLPVPSAPLPPLQYPSERPSSQPHQYSNDQTRQLSAGYSASGSASGSHSGSNCPPSTETQPANSYAQTPTSSEPHLTSSYPAPPSASQSPITPNYPAPPSSESQASSSFPATPSGDYLPPVETQRSRQGTIGMDESTRLPPISDAVRTNSSIHLPSLPPLPSVSLPKANSITLPPPGVFAADVQASGVKNSGVKRRFEDTFNDEGQYQSLSNGARQSDPHHYPPRSRLAGYDEPPSFGPRIYARADGHVEIAPDDDGSSNSARHRHAPYNL